MADTLTLEAAKRMYRSWHHAQGNRCAIAPWDGLTDEQRAEWLEKARRSSSSVSEGEMPELPEPELKAYEYSGYARVWCEDEVRKIIAADRRARQGEAERKLEIANRCIIKLQCEVEEARAATKAAAPADAPELVKLRERVVELEAMLDARLERKPDDSQEWAKVDGAIAFHLIERHSDDWNDAGRMMDAWRDANPRRASSVPAIPGTDPLDTPLPCDVKVGGMTIRKGCKLRTLVTRMESLHRMLMKHMPEPTQEQKAAFAALLADAAPSHPSEAKAGESQQ